jgi:hypothetical protein
LLAFEFCARASACGDAARRWAAAYKDELNIAVANKHRLESAFEVGDLVVCML